MNIERLKGEFAALGFKIIHIPKNKPTNGPDLWVQRNNGRPLSVEVKKARIQRNGCVQVDPVQPNRRKDDLIAIECGTEHNSIQIYCLLNQIMNMEIES